MHDMGLCLVQHEAALKIEVLLEMANHSLYSPLLCLSSSAVMPTPKGMHCEGTYLSSLEIADRNFCLGFLQYYDDAAGVLRSIMLEIIYPHRQISVRDQNVALRVPRVDSEANIADGNGEDLLDGDAYEGQARLYFDRISKSGFGCLDIRSWRFTGIYHLGFVFLDLHRSRTGFYLY